MVRSLDALGLEPRREVCTPLGYSPNPNPSPSPNPNPNPNEVCTPLGYSLDVVVSLLDGREVAVEVDGPAHFFGQVPTGATVLKRRQLRAAGWALLPVPYWEWNALGRSTHAKEAYLLAALKEMAEALPPLEESE